MTIVGLSVRGERTLTVWRCTDCLHELPIEI
jgi:hypothetical protein